AITLSAGQGGALGSYGFVQGDGAVTVVATSADGIFAILSSASPLPPEFSLFVAHYNSNPESAAIAAVDFYDVRTSGSGADARLVVTFRYNPGLGPNPVLMFFDPTTGGYRAVAGSRLVPQSLVVDPVNHTITVVFDLTSFPALTDLRRTVFAIALTPE